MDDRGRLTIPDVLFSLMSLGVIAVLWPVLNDIFESNRSAMGAGVEYLYFLILPLALLVLFSVIYVKAVGG